MYAEKWFSSELCAGWGHECCWTLGAQGVSQLRVTQLSCKAQGLSLDWVIQEPFPITHWCGAGVGQEFYLA